MSNFLLLFLIVLLHCQLNTGIFLLGKRIRGGQFPWLVQFKTVVPCGGILVSSDWVLTAAQCVQSDRQSILIQAVGLNGTASSQVINVMHAYIFPEFKNDLSNQNPNNNIALVKLVKPFDLGDSNFRFLDIGPRKLDEDYKICFIFGWQSYVGPSKKVFAKPIQYSKIVLNSWKYCAYMYKGNSSFLNVFCTMVESRDEMMACAGNPGTPVVCEDQRNRIVLLGIASWTKFSFDCGGLPSYLSINMFRAWMTEILVNASKTPETKTQDCDEVNCSAKNSENNLKNQFSQIDVSKILSEVKQLNNSNLRKFESSRISKNASVFENTDDYTMIANYDLLIGNIKEREESLQQYQEVGLNKEPVLREIKKSKIKTDFDSDELLPFTLDEYNSCSCPFVNIFFFKYGLIILCLLLTYFVCF